MSKIVALLCALALSISAHGQTDPCPSNVTVGFFNGVLTTYDKALLTTIILEDIYGNDAANDVKIAYTLFYNTTKGWGDFVETFDQRLKEQDAILQNKFYLFFESLTGGGEYSDTITTSVPLFESFLGAMGKYVSAKSVAVISDTAAYIGNMDNIEPNTFALHIRQIDTILASGQRLLMVAHSQGNLFANRAYAYFTEKASQQNLRVVHVAPASPTLHGEYTLASLDLVINGLRITFTTVPESNVEIPVYGFRGVSFADDDVTGHGFLEVYMNRALDTRQRIDQHVREAIKDLAGMVGKATYVFCDAFDRNPVGTAAWLVYPGFSIQSIENGVLGINLQSSSESIMRSRSIEFTEVPNKIIIEARIKATHALPRRWQLYLQSATSRSLAMFGDYWGKFGPGVGVTYDNVSAQYVAWDASGGSEKFVGWLDKHSLNDWAEYRMIVTRDRVIVQRGATLEDVTEVGSLETDRPIISERAYKITFGIAQETSIYGQPRVFLDWMRMAVE